jgi:hypothetical protein
VTEPSKQSGSDPVGDLQRWLVRSGARSVTRQLSGQIRTALGGGKRSTANVWETATTESDESPECPWCPHCRARRLARESGPGLGAGVAAAADAVGVVMRDAMSAFEAAVAAAGQQTRPRDATAEPPGEVWDEATDEPAVQTRPPANGDGERPSGSRPHSVAPKQASTGGKQPSSAKQPSAGAKQATGEGKRTTGEAKRPSAGAKKPAADPRKPAGRSGGSAAADRTSPDEPTPAKPDESAD